MAKTKFGSFEDLLDITEESLKPIVPALREMILNVDPNDLLQGTGKNLRHIKIRSIDELGQEEIRQLVRSALTERRKALK